MMDLTFITLLKIAIIIVLTSFLPLMAFNFLLFGKKAQVAETKRILKKLQINEDAAQIFLNDIQHWHFYPAVSFVALVSIISLGFLLLGEEMKIAEQPSYILGGVFTLQEIKQVGDNNSGQTSVINKYQLQAADCNKQLSAREVLYQKSALLVYSMAFLGAYIWGLQNLFRRFMMNDLTPSAYYGLGIRMIFSAIVALLIFHTVVPSLLLGEQTTAEVSLKYLPAFAFLVGTFPQRGLQWLSKHIQFFNTQADPSVRVLPLIMIEGISEYDKMRLEELGIDSCYDLANTDFIPLFIISPYKARELIDWILQAKLCVRFGQDIKELRNLGVRTIVDLQHLSEEEITELARGSKLDEFSIKQAVKNSDVENINRLCQAGQVLSEYWNKNE